ncbi:phosphatase PAP2 family protein [Kitasatospora sp. NPDC058965]|uniref:phosphatase PAP2 family protein n=1 Tax=Kitasatospora sp. NPDC058965 TaxID=3346682 RepID=UPI0036C3B7F0
MGTALRTLLAVDQALYAAVAAAPSRSPGLDSGLRRLSVAANRSRISFAVAGLLALRPGRPRRAALLGVAALGTASVTANQLTKTLVRRPRPDREAAEVPAARHIPMPGSASFPSGHTAAAFAFATAVGATLPAAALPLTALAGCVGYSRVHTGVHYPGDVLAGALLGVGCAGAVLAGARRLGPGRG